MVAHLGANALSGAARIVIAIDAEQERLAALEATTPVGKGTVSVTELAGGLARNIIPDACALYVGRRTAPGEDVTEVRAALCELIENSAAPLSTTIESLYGDGSPGFYQDPDGALITNLAQLADSAPTTRPGSTSAAAEQAWVKDYHRLNLRSGPGTEFRGGQGPEFVVASDHHVHKGHVAHGQDRGLIPHPELLVGTGGLRVVIRVP